MDLEHEGLTTACVSSATTHGLRGCGDRRRGKKTRMHSGAACQPRPTPAAKPSGRISTPSSSSRPACSGSWSFLITTTRAGSMPNRRSSCAAAGLTVRLVALQDLPPKGDVSDYLSANSREDLLSLIKAAPVWTPPVNQPASPAAGPVVVCMADVEPEEISWVWSRRLAKGKLTLLVSDGGVGRDHGDRCDCADHAR